MFNLWGCDPSPPPPTKININNRTCEVLPPSVIYPLVTSNAYLAQLFNVICHFSHIHIIKRVPQNNYGTVTALMPIIITQRSIVTDL